jgi:ankyrin repeat protein
MRKRNSIREVNMKKIIFFISLNVVVLFTIAYAGAFHEYVSKCDMASVKKFIDAGVDINAIDTPSESPPLWYAINNYDGCGKGSSGDKKKYEMVKLLLENGADVNYGSDENILSDPVYFYAYRCGSYAIKCYDLLIQKGADITFKKQQLDRDLKTYYSTPLTEIFRDIVMDLEVERNRSKVQKSVKDKIPSIKYLLAKEVDVNDIVHIGDSGPKKSMLDIAFEAGDFELINLLKKHGAKKRIDIEVDNIRN